MSSKINLSEIFSDHFKSMRNERSGKISYVDIFVFYGIPIILGLSVLYTDLKFSDGAVTIIVASLSIFAALLINVLMLIYNISDRSNGPKNPDETRKEELTKLFISEIFSNISYSIVVAIISIILLSIIIFMSNYIRLLMTAVVAAFITNFVLTLAMAIKRIHILLRLKFNESQN